MGQIIEIFVHLCKFNMKRPMSNPWCLFIIFLSLDYEKYDRSDTFSVEYFPCKHKGLSLVPRNQIMLGVVACTCNPGLGRQIWEDFRDSLTSQPIPFGEFQATETPCIKKHCGMTAGMHTQICTHMHTQLWTHFCQSACTRNTDRQTERQTHLERTNTCIVMLYSFKW